MSWVAIISIKFNCAALRIINRLSQDSLVRQLIVCCYIWIFVGRNVTSYYV